MNLNLKTIGAIIGTIVTVAVVLYFGNIILTNLP